MDKKMYKQKGQTALSNNVESPSLCLFTSKVYTRRNLKSSMYMHIKTIENQNND